MNNGKGKINDRRSGLRFNGYPVRAADYARGIYGIVGGKLVHLVLPVPEAVARNIDCHDIIACFGDGLFEVRGRDARYIVLTGFTAINESYCFYWGSWLSFS